MDGLHTQPAWRSPFPNQKLHETRSFSWPLGTDSESSENNKGFLKYRRFEFQAGHSIGHPAKWSLFLISCNNNININEDATDFLGLFLDKKDPPDLEDLVQEEDFKSTEFVVRCNIEVLKYEGGNLATVTSRDVETAPRDVISEGYWGWRQVTPILQSCTNIMSTDTINHNKSDVKGSDLELRIRFTITGHGKDLLNKIPSSHMNLLAKEQDSEREIAMTFYKLVLSGKTDPDFLIETQGKRYLVHQEILGARSPVFRRMFETSMTESYFSKAYIDDISSETLSCILRHVYTGQVEQDWLSRPQLAKELVYAAEKYWLGYLRSFCDKHLVRAATIKNCLQLLELASLYDLERATDDLTRFVHAKMVNRLKSSSRMLIRDSGDEEEIDDDNGK